MHKKTTKLLAVIGHPIGHSLSPLIHNGFAESLGLPYVYTAFDIEAGQLAGFIDAARLLDIRGFNLTMPHKVEVLPHLDALHGSAEQCGAINTVAQRDNRLLGYNTDGDGFLLSLERAGFSPDSANALILGAGGAAKAVVPALRGRGSRVSVATRRTIDLPADDYFTWDKLSAAAKDCTLLINATPLGMNGVLGDFTDFSFLDALHGGAMVCDLIYAPRETSLLKAARERGLRVVNGLPMLVNQAALAFELFTGVAPTQSCVEDILRRLENERF